eukprot:scaffold3943_cov169-Ochromonas_danica.AAC.4
MMKGKNHSVTGHSRPPRSKSSSPELKGRGGSISDLAKLEFHHSSSAFQNSPDPSSLPLPMFEEEEEQEMQQQLSSSPGSSYADYGSKTQRLRQFLNLHRPTI